MSGVSGIVSRDGVNYRISISTGLTQDKKPTVRVESVPITAADEAMNSARVSYLITSGWDQKYEPNGGEPDPVASPDTVQEMGGGRRVYTYNSDTLGAVSVAEEEALREAQALRNELQGKRNPQMAEANRLVSQLEALIKVQVIKK